MSSPDPESPPQSGHAPQPGRPRSRRVLLAGLAALVPAVPLAVGLSIGLGPGPRAGALTQASSPFVPVAAAARPPTAPARRASGPFVALLTRATELRAAPGGAGLGALGLRTPFGSPQALLVVARRPGWLGVLSPVAGNGRTGWISRADAVLGMVAWRITVSLRHREVAVSDGGRLLARYRSAIGMPAAPTPTGTFAVTDRLSTGDPAGPYGCCILALSALAPHAISDWSGGNRIAIHATTETWSIGESVSHGCLRVSEADARWLIAHVPLGTPVVIRS
jgi:hypothetical protein